MGSGGGVPLSRSLCDPEMGPGGDLILGEFERFCTKKIAARNGFVYRPILAFIDANWFDTRGNALLELGVLQKRFTSFHKPDPGLSLGPVCKRKG